LNEVSSGFARQCHKDEYRGILAAREGITGKKAVNTKAMNVKLDLVLSAV
jgi:hypothetical protein